MVVLAISLASPASQAAAATSPEIRSSPANPVPACVTPERLMSFLATRNSGVDRRYADIAAWYRHYGLAWRVRWDYAFFQMALETNFLTYRRGNGRWGDVHPSQNNFAGLGTTGGGVPGDSFPDVKTGVLAQIQHLVAYSGERLAEPVASRTRLRQDDIVEVSKKLGRAVRFSDLARRWAVDRHYGRSIEWVASQFRRAYCGNERPEPATVAARQSPRESLPWALSARAPDASALYPATRPDPPRADAEAPRRCEIVMASYGGERTLLIRAAGEAIRYTALTVVDGFEDSMASNYISAHAPGGSTLGAFETRDAALARARELCPVP